MKYKDLHREAAARLFGVPPAQVSDEQREQVKRSGLVLMPMYGMSRVKAERLVKGVFDAST